MWNRRKVILFLPINPFMFIFKIYNLIDEEINVLVIGLLCIRTLEVLKPTVLSVNVVEDLVHYQL